jgi:hypothetical protein
MLKKAGNIVIALLLLTMTSGMTIIRHYCGSNLSEVAVFSTPHNCCGDHCPFCHNEKITIRITDQFQSSNVNADLSAGFKTLMQHHSLPTLLAFHNPSTVSLLNRAPGDHSLKPGLANTLAAGHSSEYLQVFLF